MVHFENLSSRALISSGLASAVTMRRIWAVAKRPASQAGIDRGNFFVSSLTGAKLAAMMVNYSPEFSRIRSCVAVLLLGARGNGSRQTCGSSKAPARLPQEGPLGSYWRIEVADQQSRTVIGHPVFLRAS